MKVRNFIGAIALAGLALAPQAALAQAASSGTTAAKVDDSTLKSRIDARLKNSPTLKGNDIDVAVDNGVVTLTGTVHSEAQSVRARSLAKIAGVTNVDNKLTVDSKTTRAMDKAGSKTDAAMDKAGDKTDKAMDKAGDKTDKAMDKTADKTGKAGDKTASTAQKAGHKTEKVLEKAGIKVEDDKTAVKNGDATRTTGTAGQAGVKGKDDVIDVDANINDAWITTKVKSNFVNEDALKGSSINVDTNKHVVTLKGTVTSAAGRARAVELAKSTKGVTRVIDALTIGPSK
jgi:hyperosmotically inducible periplasmic protein